MNWNIEIISVLASQLAMKRHEIFNAIKKQNSMEIKSKNPNNSFNHHFRQLLDSGYILKVAKGLYRVNYELIKCHA